MFIFAALHLEALLEITSYSVYKSAHKQTPCGKIVL